MPHQVGGLLRLLQCGRCCSTMLAAGICPYGNNGVVANAARYCCQKYMHPPSSNRLCEGDGVGGCGAVVLPW